LAIGAAGSTTWERCALGLPTIIVQIAENQAGIARALRDAGAALDPGPLNAPEFAQNLQAALAEAPSQMGVMSDRAADICDGDGTARVLAALGMKVFA
jgi:spore coat polysaccharide biosynthesis predicted glycosyltransferase SpsG